MVYKENNPILHGASGSLDNITFRNVNGQLVVTRKQGPRKKPASEAQLKNEARFAFAAAHAVAALKDSSVYAYFKALGKKNYRTAYVMALRFYLGELKAGRMVMGDRCAPQEIAVPGELCAANMEKSEKKREGRGEPWVASSSGVMLGYSLPGPQSSSSIFTLAVANGLSVTSTWVKPYWV